MKYFTYLFILFFSLLSSTQLFAQDPPRQFDFPCADADFPLGAESSLLTVIVTFDGGLYTEGDFVAAIDSDGFIVGVGTIENVEACTGVQSVLNIIVYKDLSDNACAASWGANTGENVALVVFHNNNFFEISANTPYPATSNDGFAFVNDDPCSVVNTTSADTYAPFPVTLESFRGYTVNSSKAVQLEWISGQEEDVSHYEVEYSKNGIDWEPIGRVEAAGNSTERISYGFLDNGDLNAENFYRLNMMDLDGSSDLSGIVIVTINDTGDRQVRIFPNPANAMSGQLSVQLKGQWNEGQSITGELFDAQGRSLQQYGNLNQGTTTLALPAGTKQGLYLLRVTQADAVFTHKISLQ